MGLIDQVVRDRRKRHGKANPFTTWRQSIWTQRRDAARALDVSLATVSSIELGYPRGLSERIQDAISGAGGDGRKVAKDYRRWRRGTR